MLESEPGGNGLDPGLHSRSARSTATYHVYMLASRRNGTLYIGVTNDLVRRVYEHKHKLVDGFSKKYGVDKLVWFDITPYTRRDPAREDDEALEPSLEGRSDREG